MGFESAGNYAKDAKLTIWLGVRNTDGFEGK